MNIIARKVQLSVQAITGFLRVALQHLYDNYQIEIIH
jgi:hypothetical protein